MQNANFKNQGQRKEYRSLVLRRQLKPLLDYHAGKLNKTPRNFGQR